ncbi:MULTISPECIES: Na/Pi symporter [Alteribacter]|uniref:Na/Pi cotransporter family protein n=1 Tax=Alteribacter keqinensis TaxID=2483800 RepID=A0A3M7TT83_9BACI|nr:MULTISPECIES: Na/Pi symporter [Alteribacter]MBM7097114.1 Na/Pi cotransporter family protein [Alteribacter salitolerans]RNA68860.1 Na/Pi cotransporter family protein [Alteribacter keqinensis]
MKELFSLFAIYISLFLFGMTVMRQGLFNLQRRRMSELLISFIDKPYKGLIIGTVVTGLLQSSSAVMIMTVGLVATRVISFRHSIGIMLGANIGTCLTLEIVALDINWLIIPLLIIGLPLLMTKNQVLFCLGCFSFGLGSIFVAMHGFETLAYPLSSLASVHDWLISTDEKGTIALMLGVVMSGIIQSSSAVSAITMSFMNENILSLPTGIAIMLGANIGTCVTAWLASIGGSLESRLTAYAHIWINVIGALLFFPFIHLFSDLIMYTAESPAVQLAHAATVFNVISSAVILPFTDRFAGFLLWVHRVKDMRI